MKILVATDGSDFSMAAVEECCRMIIHPENKPEVLIVSAYENAYPMAPEPFAISTEYYQHLDEAVREQANNYLESARLMVKEHFPSESFPVETEVLRGSPVQQIIERATEWGADLIVVGSHGRGFWGRLLGSVSNGVVHHAPCSVMIVRKPT